MSRRLLRGAGWTLAATLLLGLGFALFLHLASRLVEGTAASADEKRLALSAWGELVLLKGLLPQLWITLALWPLLDRLLGLRARGRLHVALGLVGVGLVAGVFVAGALLTLPVPGLPVAVYQGPGNFVSTVLQMTAAVAVAALIPRWWLDRPARRPDATAA